MSYDIITDDIIEIARLKRMTLHKGHEVYTVKKDEIIKMGLNLNITQEIWGLE